MSEKKRQHFVPQFYLRQFCAPGTDKICAATVDPVKVIPTPIGIKGQCQSAYFYGSDLELENIYAESESIIAPILRSVISGPSINDDQVEGLKWLPTELRGRTRKASNLAQLPVIDVHAFVLKAAVDAGKLPPPPDPEDFKRFTFPNTPQVLATIHVQSYLEMATLKHKLLKAAPGKFFMTSDNPAVCLNEYPTGKARLWVLRPFSP